MKMTNLMVAAGLACSLSAVALADKPALQQAEGMKVNPTRMAQVKVVDGKVQMVGGWVDCNNFGSRVDESCLWDGFGRQWGAGSTGTPEEDPSSACALGGSRWFFGDGYLNPYTEDDVVGAGSGALASIDGGWYWNPAAGSGTCLLFYLWNDTSDVNNCVADGSLGTLGGVIFDFGDLPSGGGFYYYFNGDTTSLGVNFDGTATTSHVVIIASAFDGSTITLAAENTQPMLWGTPANNGTGYVAWPGAVGDQLEGALDDDAPTDGAHDLVAECYTYAFGVCPDPLGKMVAYGTSGCGGACPADFNGDGFVSGDDFDQYVAAFELGDASADFNCDGFVSGDDFDAFVAAFELGCG